MGGGPSSFPSDKHIVVVGAGYGGCTLANELIARKANFTLISARDCWHHCVASLRACLKPEFVDISLIPLKETFGDHLKIGEVVSIDGKEKKVVLKSGEMVSYDILVMATGSGGPFPVKFGDSVNKADIVPRYQNSYEKIKEAQRIVVVGGGATGVEFAVEIASQYPDKEVTLIHSKDYLINEKMTSNFQNKLKGILDRYKIKVILGEKVDDLDSVPEYEATTVKTDKGTTIECDIVLKTIGLPVNTSAYKNSLGEVMEENGQLKVNDFLLVEGQDEIYAIGDCCNTKDVKTAYCASEHAKAFVLNLQSRFAGKAEKPWKAGQLPVVLMLALGPHSGLGQTTSGWVLGEWLSVWVKSRDLLSKRFWKEMKQTIPHKL